MMYFSDGTEEYMPSTYGSIQDGGESSWEKLFEIDSNTVSCPNNGKVYNIHQNAANGVALEVIEYSDSIVAGDGFHHKNKFALKN